MANQSFIIILWCLLTIWTVESMPNLPKVAFELPDMEKPEEVVALEGPPDYNDIDDDRMRCIAAYEWCVKYKYVKVKQDVENMDLKKCLDSLHEPIKKIKTYFKFEIIDGKLDRDVLTLMSKPRCAEEDHADEEHERKKRWARLGRTTWKDMPVTISFERYISSIPNSVQDRIVKHCATLWAQSSGLSFAMAKPGEKGNINIMATHIDGKWGTVGQGLSPNVWSRPPSSYLKLDSAEIWKEGLSGGGFGVSLTWAICHEMGHNLALGHSHDRNAIMYPSGTGQDENKLHFDDIRGIQSLYGRPNGRTFEGSRAVPDIPSPSSIFNNIISRRRSPPPPPPRRRTFTRRPNRRPSPRSRRPVFRSRRPPTRSRRPAPPPPPPRRQPASRQPTANLLPFSDHKETKEESHDDVITGHHDDTDSRDDTHDIRDDTHDRDTRLRSSRPPPPPPFRSRSLLPLRREEPTRDEEDDPTPPTHSLTNSHTDPRRHSLLPPSRNVLPPPSSRADPRRNFAPPGHTPNIAPRREPPRRIPSPGPRRGGRFQDLFAHTWG